MVVFISNNYNNNVSFSLGSKGSIPIDYGSFSLTIPVSLVTAPIN